MNVYVFFHHIDPATNTSYYGRGYKSSGGKKKPHDSISSSEEEFY